CPSCALAYASSTACRRNRRPPRERRRRTPPNSRGRSTTFDNFSRTEEPCPHLMWPRLHHTEAAARRSRKHDDLLREHLPGRHHSEGCLGPNAGNHHYRVEPTSGFEQGRCVTAPLPPALLSTL